MNKSARSKYHLFFALTMLTVILPFVSICLIVTDVLGLFTLISNKTALYVLEGVLFLVFFLRKPFDRKMNKYKQLSEYDEFGLKKKKNGRYDLSKEERQALDLQQMANMERILSENTLKKIKHTGSKNPEADMKKLIGLEPVKQKMNEMVARMQFEKQVHGKKKRKQDDNSMSGRHMVFYGNPGTGKTTVKSQNGNQVQLRWRIVH